LLRPAGFPIIGYNAQRWFLVNGFGTEERAREAGRMKANHGRMVGIEPALSGTYY